MHFITSFPSFINPIPTPSSIKRPRPTTHFISTCSIKNQSNASSSSSPSPPSSTKLSLPTKITSALIASLVIATSTISPVHAKNLLSDNTIFRRYLITDSSAVLRYSLPLPDDPDPIPIRLIQDCLEKLGVYQHSSGVASLISSRRAVSDLQNLLTQRQLDVLLDVPAKNRQKAAETLSKLETTVNQIRSEIGDSGPVIGESFLPTRAIKAQQTLKDAFTPRNNTKQLANFDPLYLDKLRLEALDYVSDIEQLVVESSGPSFRIPRRYNEYPRLMGRAEISFTVEKKANGKWMNDITKQPIDQKQIMMTAVLDGYSAPLTCGHFVDLSQRGVFTNTNVISTQKDFYIQLAPSNTSSSNREIPLEILPQDEPAPVYGITLDEAGIGDVPPKLPVSAFGAMAMFHSIENVNDASSQFYVFTLDPNSYQARSLGGSILTGSVATFGYIIEGKEFLSQMQTGDRIVNAKVISGMEHFRENGDR